MMVTQAARLETTISVLRQSIEDGIGGISDDLSLADKEDAEDKIAKLEATIDLMRATSLESLEESWKVRAEKLQVRRMSFWSACVGGREFGVCVHVVV
jgi:hypothetical protein